jgi:hypothetical protein
MRSVALFIVTGTKARNGYLKEDKILKRWRLNATDCCTFISIFKLPGNLIIRSEF